MDENVLATLLLDEAESFCIIEPFNRSFYHLSCSL